MKIADDKLQQLNCYFKTKPVHKAYLFGSYARGEADNKSDIDILIEFEKDSHVGLMGFARLIFDIENITNSKVDLVSDAGLSKHIRPYIEKEKVLIYERK